MSEGAPTISPPESNESEPNRSLDERLFEDGDLICNDDFLQQIALATDPNDTEQRIPYLERAAIRIYTGADDFAEYFRKFPQDAQYIIDFCTNPPQEPGGRLRNTILLAKTFEAAAKSIEGLWQEIERQITEHSQPSSDRRLERAVSLCERSKLARGLLMGTPENQALYKTTTPARFKPYGSKLYEHTMTLLDDLEGQTNYHPNRRLSIEHGILASPEYDRLSLAQKIHFLQNIIAECHNSLVFHEVFVDDIAIPGQKAKPSRITTGIDDENNFTSRIVGRGMHSILYKSRHSEQPFHLNEFDEYISPYEQVISSAITEITKLVSDNRTQDSDNTPQARAADGSISFLLNFWDKNRDPLYGPAIASVLSAADMTQAAAQIYARLQQADELDRRRLCSLLLNIETGRMDIGSSGFDYLGKKFNLGEYNHSGYFAHRLSPHGQMGIFDQNGYLLGAIRIVAEDFLSDQSQSVDKSVEALTPDMLAAGHSTNPRSKEILELYRRECFGEYILSFPSKCGLRFEDLELAEQGWALYHFAHTSEAQQTQFYNFVKKFGEEGFRVFQLLELDDAMADYILTLEQKVGEEAARAIYGKCNALVKQAGRIEEYVGNQLSVELSANDRQDVISNLLGKARSIIEHYARAGSVASDDAQKIQAELDSCSVEIMLFAEIFRTIKSGEAEVSLEDFKDVTVEIVSGADLSLQDRAEMTAIFNTNWDIPELHDLYTAIKDSFVHDALHDADSRFYIVRHNGQDGGRIVTFQRFQDKDNYIYASSNNVRPEARGHRIGEEAQQAILRREAEKNLVVATAYPKLAIASHYLASSGFVCTDAIEDYQKSGQPHLVIAVDLPANESGVYRYQGCPGDKIIADYRSGETHGAEVVELEISALGTDNKELDARFCQAVKSHLAEGNKVMTAMVKIDSDSETIKFLAVFEPNASSKTVSCNEGKIAVSDRFPPQHIAPDIAA